MQLIDWSQLDGVCDSGLHQEREPIPLTILHVLKELTVELVALDEDCDDDTLCSILDGVLARDGLMLTRIERDQVLALVEREKRPFGVLQDLIETPEVSDVIISDYAKIAVQRRRCTYKTGLRFPNQDSYETFVERLLLRAQTTYSVKKPVADGMIGPSIRIHAVHRSLCETGPYVTIRINRFPSVSIADLVRAGLAPAPVLEYLRALVETGQTLLIAGEVGSGKTTLARAVAGTIPEEESILVIEDTREIKLNHPHVRYLETRMANAEDAGKISSAECIRAGMRMAMHRIILGEIRDAEAAESFIDACASGHPGLTTIHAKSAMEAVLRMELFLGRSQRGVEKAVLTQQVATAVQCVVYVGICKATNARRIFEVREIGQVADGVLRTREIFKYAPARAMPLWRFVQRSSAFREKLEAASPPVFLNELDEVLELGVDDQFRIASNGAI